jgi:putative ABC transport system permease protein
MPPAWRLATSSLLGRPNRSLLLCASVVLSAALIAAVACAIDSANNAVRRQVDITVGTADARIKPAGSGRTLDASWLGRARRWPEVADAEGRLQASVNVTFKAKVLTPGKDGLYWPVETALPSTALAIASTSAAARAGGAYELIAGRDATADGEVVIDAFLAARPGLQARAAREQQDGFVLGPKAGYAPPARTEPPAPAVAEQAEKYNAGLRVGIGDELQVVRQVVPGVDLSALGSLFGKSPTIRVVGIAAQGPLGGRAQCFMTVPTLARLSGQVGLLSEIRLTLRPEFTAESLVQAHRAEIPSGLLLETTEKVTSGLNKNLRSSELGFVLASVLAFMSAAFIILTGLNTSVTERQRELAILRCVGATRGQLACSQLVVGAILGGVGGVLGLPLGIGVAWLLATAFKEQLPTGLTVPSSAVWLSLAGSMLSGIAGAAWPAYQASRISPLAALGSRAAQPSRRGVVIVLVVGLAALLVEALLVAIPRDGQFVFWAYATVGLPVMFSGYFLLGVPATLLVVVVAAPVVSKVLGLPPKLLGRTIAATPYRHGFTAGALMSGLALMVALWTNGGTILRDWLEKICFPDAFVSGLNLPPEAQARLNALSFVTDTCAISLFPVETNVFGVHALQKYKTTFVAFEPASFFRMAKLVWVQGDEETALRRLEAGGAVIVAREFLIAQGLGVGQTFTCTQDGTEYPFEIVGVVASPGLEIVSKFFNVGEDYTDQALHAVFGSRRDLKEKFHSDAIQLIQLSLKPDADERAALQQVRDTLQDLPILDVGSGRAIKKEIRTFATGTLLVFSSVAVVAMLVACFGVASLVVAGIEARQFEFGVLRAVGASRGMLSRLVIGEALIVALTACVLGTLMGLQGAWAGRRLYALLLGLSLQPYVPGGAIAAGWGVVFVLTLAAAGPAVWRLGRKRPRELLGVVRG